MSSRDVLIAAMSIFTPLFLSLTWSVPRKAGVGFLSRLRVHYTTSDWSFWVEGIQAIFSLTTVTLFIIGSYHWDNTYVTISFKIEVFFAVFYAYNYALELLLSKNRLSHVLSLLSIVDVITTVPIFYALASGYSSSDTAGFVRFYRIITLTKVFKPFRLLRVVGTMGPSGDDAVMVQTCKTVAYFVSTLFLATGLVQVLSDGTADEWGDISTPENRPMSFHDALYFIIVTFSTVGYGDISPPTTLSRLVIVLLVGFFFFMIPRELNQLNSLLDLSSKYTGTYPKKLCGGHIIIGCDVDTCGLVAAFLEEFFHEDHGHSFMSLVLLVPSEPTMEWKRLVLKFSTNDRVTYLRGDLRITDDLHRVSAETASTCFILANRHGNLKEEEKRCFMRAISLKDFNPNMNIFVEALSVGMRKRLVKVGINPARIVCTSTLNTRMLANACAWEGASTLVNNLLVSASIDEQRDMPSWVKEYASGLGKEIYVVSIGAFVGRGFSSLVLELFQQYGVVLLGISEDRRVTLHPGASYTIATGDLGFLVADDANVAETIVQRAGATVPLVREKSFKKTAQPATNARGASGRGPGVSSKVGGNPFHRSPSSGTPKIGSVHNDAAATKRAVSTVDVEEVGVGGINDEEGKDQGGDDGTLVRITASSATNGAAGTSGSVESTPRTPYSAALSAVRTAGQGRPWAGAGEYIVLVTPSLGQVSTLVEALEAPQIPPMGIVVVCPLYDWNQEQDEEEMRRLRTFPQVRLVIGPASIKALKAAGANRAKMIIMRAGKSFSDQGMSDADADTIGQIVEVSATAGQKKRTIIELNDVTYCHHHEVIIARIRNGEQQRKLAFQAAAALASPRAGGNRNNLRSPASSGHGEALAVGRRSTASNDRDQSKRESTGRDQDSDDDAAVAEAEAQGEPSAPAPPAHVSPSDPGSIHWSFSRGFASGAIVASSLPETLLCQAFYNPAIIMIVEALLDPKGDGYSRAHQKHGECFSDDDSDGPASPPGRSVESFLAQIAPPKKFFTEAALNGNRPNFQVLMAFMLREYDALPLGLLRCDKVKGSSSRGAAEQASPKFVHCCPSPDQKVMPLDKVYILAPNLQSWERMLQESPPKRASFPMSPAPRTTPVPPSRDPQDRGFPEERNGPPLDDRGFPLEAEVDDAARGMPLLLSDHEYHPEEAPGTSPSQKNDGATGRAVTLEAEANGTARSTPLRSRCSTPFESASPTEEKAAEFVAPKPHRGFNRSWATASHQAERGIASISPTTDVGSTHGQSQGGRFSPHFTNPQKGSHAKLDLLLQEVQRLNGRLDTIVGRLGDLE